MHPVWTLSFKLPTLSYGCTNLVFCKCQITECIAIISFITSANKVMYVTVLSCECVFSIVSMSKIVKNVMDDFSLNLDQKYA